LMSVLAVSFNLTQVFSLASFSVIATHVLVNYSAFKLDKRKRKFKVPFSPIPQLLGIASCLVLAYSLLPTTWMMALVVLAIGIVFYLFGRPRR